MNPFVEPLPPQPKPAPRPARTGRAVSAGAGDPSFFLPAARPLSLWPAGSRPRLGPDEIGPSPGASALTRGLVSPHSERLVHIEEASACQRRSRGDARGASGGERNVRLTPFLEQASRRERLEEGSPAPARGAPGRLPDR